MSLKYAIFKICPKIAQNDILVKQKSIPSSPSPFLDLGIPSPIFLHPKSLKMDVFAKDERWDLDFENCPDIEAVTW